MHMTLSSRLKSPIWPGRGNADSHPCLVSKVGVHRVGIADTVGCATPRQVYDLVRTLRGVVRCDIET